MTPSSHINWKLWAATPTVLLWEGVALVNGIDPHRLRLSEASDGGYLPSGPPKIPAFRPSSFSPLGAHVRFQEAAKHADRATTYDGPIHAIATDKGCAVSLCELVKFFVAYGWEGIPEPLVALVGVSEHQVGHATSAPAPAAESVPVEALKPIGLTLTTPELADAFDDIEVSAERWRKRLGDLRNHAWLALARATATKAPTPASWYPLKFAELLRERGATDDCLNRAFLAPALKPWRLKWQEARRERNAFGQ